MTMSDQLARHARTTPDAVALRFDGAGRSYAELDERVTRLARALRRARRRHRRPDRRPGAQRHGGLGGLPGRRAARRDRRPGELPAGAPTRSPTCSPTPAPTALVVDSALAEVAAKAREQAPASARCWSIGGATAGRQRGLRGGAGGRRHRAARRRRRRGRARVHHVHVGHDRPPQGRGADPPQPADARVQPGHAPRLAPRRPGRRPRRAAVPHRRAGRRPAAAAARRHQRDHEVRRLRPGRDARPDRAGADLAASSSCRPCGPPSSRCPTSPTATSRTCAGSPGARHRRRRRCCAR